MKQLFWLFGFLLVLSVYSSPTLAREAQEDEIVFQYVDPLVKIFRNTAQFPQREARADVARGEHATLQFVIRSSCRLQDLRVSVEALKSDSGHLTEAKVGYIGYVHVGSLAKREPALDRLRSNSGYYPDPILEDPPKDLNAAVAQPVWVTIPIPKVSTPGDYRGDVVLTARMGGKKVRVVRPIIVRVYPPVIKDTRLWVTNWWFGVPGMHPTTINYMNGGKHVEMFSERYWELVRSLAGTMAEYRQNVALIPTLHLTQYQLEDGHYEFDFSQFDKMIELFMEEGVIGRIEGGHLGGRASESFNHASPFRVYVPEVQSDTTTFGKYSITEERAKSFYQQFIPTLVAHLKEKGWYDIYTQHIADEPHESNADSYVAIATFFKRLAPDLRFIDAALSQKLNGLLDTWVPTLDGFHKNYEFYKERSQAGDELWFYTCVVPQGEYANRFVELPLIKTRILHWINFRYGATGYLHWGFNLWRDDPFEKAQTKGWPGGDPWIVYPKEGGVLPSIRLEEMRNGIVDYELLAMLEERQPGVAKNLVRSVVHNFNRYNTYVPTFRDTRRQLLELLSQEWEKDEL